MTKKKRYCCLCGKEISGWGNEPSGALDSEQKIMEFGKEEECCSECDTKKVVPGRMLLESARMTLGVFRKNMEGLNVTEEDLKARVTVIGDAGLVSKPLCNCIINNWDYLNGIVKKEAK